jgi:hypothetical protein
MLVNSWAVKKHRIKNERSPSSMMFHMQTCKTTYGENICQSLMKDNELIPKIDVEQ